MESNRYFFLHFSSKKKVSISIDRAKQWENNERERERRVIYSFILEQKWIVDFFVVAENYLENCLNWGIIFYDKFFLFCFFFDDDDELKRERENKLNTYL